MKEGGGGLTLVLVPRHVAQPQQLLQPTINNINLLLLLLLLLLFLLLLLLLTSRCA